MNYIIKPCQWETINLAIEQDPNKFGEALRNYCFIGNCMQTGCYSTFNIISELKETKEGLIFEEAKLRINPEYDRDLKVYHSELKEEDCYLDIKKKYKFIEPYVLVCAWEWNGDGTLYFRWQNKAVINTYCKKDYVWEWV